MGPGERRRRFLRMPTRAKRATPSTPLPIPLLSRRSLFFSPRLVGKPPRQRHLSAAATSTRDQQWSLRGACKRLTAQLSLYTLPLLLVGCRLCSGHCLDSLLFGEETTATRSVKGSAQALLKGPASLEHSPSPASSSSTLVIACRLQPTPEQKAAILDSLPPKRQSSQSDHPNTLARPQSSLPHSCPPRPIKGSRMVSDLFISLSPRPRSSMASHKPSRRTALTPPTVIPPSLSAVDNPATTRPVAITTGSHSRATSLLARVVSTPGSPTKQMSSSPTSPLPSPGETSSMMDRRYSGPSINEEKGVTGRPPMMRFATMPAYSQQSGGYVSFPDFDLICQENKTFKDQPSHTAVKT